MYMAYRIRLNTDLDASQRIRRVSEAGMHHMMIHMHKLRSMISMYMLMWMHSV
jgi:hypothetical protein